jgi:predicted metal-dependent hydrolase
MREIYRTFVEAAATRHRVLRLRSARGRRVASGPQGAVHDLERLFTRLNRRYFGGTLRQPHLGWSAQAWTRQLGIFDPGVHQIVLNLRLDRPTVPCYAVEYALYHEMLHVRHPVRRAACGLQAHSPEFRRAEKRFVDYERARRILARLS